MIEIKHKLHIMFCYCPSGRLNLDTKLKAQEKFLAEKTKEYGELFLNKKLRSSYINWKSYGEWSAWPGCIFEKPKGWF